MSAAPWHECSRPASWAPGLEGHLGPCCRSRWPCRVWPTERRVWPGGSGWRHRHWPGWSPDKHRHLWSQLRWQRNRLFLFLGLGGGAKAPKQISGDSWTSWLKTMVASETQQNSVKPAVGNLKDNLCFVLRAEGLFFLLNKHSLWRKRRRKSRKLGF